MLTILLALSFNLNSIWDDAFEHFTETAPKTATIVSLDIPWESEDEVAASAEAPPPPPPPEPEPEPEPIPVSSRSAAVEAPVSAPANVSSSAVYSLRDLMFHGVINWNGYKFTYYSQSVLPGGGLAIPGRHVNSSGYVADANGYIVLAAPYGVSHGTTFPTPFGYTGKVYDTCASCSTSPMWLDVYTK